MIEVDWERDDQLVVVGFCTMDRLLLLPSSLSATLRPHGITAWEGNDSYYLIISGPQGWMDDG